MNSPNICVSIDFHLCTPVKQFIFVLFHFFFHFLRDPAPVTQAFFLGIVLFGRLCDLQILFQ